MAQAVRLLNEYLIRTEKDEWHTFILDVGATRSIDVTNHWNIHEIFQEAPKCIVECAVI